MRELPPKYYLSHFNEFIAYIQNHCEHLLLVEHQQFIARYHALDENTQCMLVRTVNRRGSFIAREKMIYQEIDDCSMQLSLLCQGEFLRPLQNDDWREWLEMLSKIQLLNVLSTQSSCSYPRSANKSTLLLLAKKYCQVEGIFSHDLSHAFLVKNYSHILGYFLFLFFGDLKSGLDKFSMRDLGVLKTRDVAEKQSARFDTRETALSSFYYAQRKILIAELPEENLAAEHELAINSSLPIGIRANDYCDQYLLTLGKRLLPVDHKAALTILARSCHPKAQEKWLRETYKNGDKQLVKHKLEVILKSEVDEALLLFADDFYQRKYNQRKLSKRTTLLRDYSHTLKIDEIYKDKVEQGVLQSYQQLGTDVYFTENRIFNALFGLTFWLELFAVDDKSVSTEFDRRPRLVRENAIYKTIGDKIDSRLRMFHETEKALVYISMIASKYYGEPNGMFHWQANMLEVLSLLIRHSEPEILVTHLRAMAKDYRKLSDGYPDLMVVDTGKLRFEEVKAQGDQLRTNQMITIAAMQQAGFDVRLCRVEWFCDPMQSYVVVDVETTGGKSGGHRITEIGAVKIVNGREVDSWSSLVNPQRHIPRFITQLTGISNDMVAGAPLFCELVDSFDAFIQNSIFVAHNVSFDYGFFQAEYGRLERNFRMPKLCTVREMRKYYPGLPSYSLGNLCKEFGIELESHHRALCDAKAAAELLFMVNERKQNQSQSFSLAT
jgi:DNA polymerase-3 subunit epsilon